MAEVEWRPKCAYLCTNFYHQIFFGYLVWVCLKCTIPKNVHSWSGAPNVHTSAPNIPPKVFLDPWYVCFWNARWQKMCTLGVAPQMCILLHQICHQKYFWIPTVGVFERHNANKCAFWGWRAEHAYLCTKRTTKSVSGCLVWVVLKCTMPNMCIVGVAPQTCMPLDQTYHQKCFWIPGIGGFEMHNAKKWALLGWRTKRAYIYTNDSTEGFFGYLVWVFLKCTMPKNVHYWGGTPNVHTSAPNGPPKVFLDAWYGYVWNAQCQKSAFWGDAPNLHTSAPNMPPKIFLDT